MTELIRHDLPAIDSVKSFKRENFALVRLVICKRQQFLGAPQNTRTPKYWKGYEPLAISMKLKLKWHLNVESK